MVLMDVCPFCPLLPALTASRISPQSNLCHRLRCKSDCYRCQGFSSAPACWTAALHPMTLAMPQPTPVISNCHIRSPKLGLHTRPYCELSASKVSISQSLPASQGVYISPESRFAAFHISFLFCICLFS